MTLELERMTALALAKARADHLAAGHQTPKCKICRMLLPTRRAISASWLEGRSLASIARQYRVSVPTLRKHLTACELPNLQLAQRHSALDWTGILDDLIAAQNDLREMARALASSGEAETALAAIRQTLAIFDRRLGLARMLNQFDLDQYRTFTKALYAQAETDGPIDTNAFERLAREYPSVASALGCGHAQEVPSW